MYKLILSCVVCLGLSTTVKAASEVNFTLSLNDFDSGATYTDMHRGGGGTDNVFIIGFDLLINTIDGEPSDDSFSEPFAGFCTELGESISATTYTFDLIDLKNIARGHAGEVGHPSQYIPDGGIGSLRASRVRYLFDQYYESPVMNEWTSTQYTQAFQLAVWELTHDDDFSLSDDVGAIYLPVQNNDHRDGAIGLAQDWLDEIENADPDGSYHGQSYNVWGLEDLGQPGIQDVLLGVPIGTSGEETLNELLPVPVPEPSTLGLLVIAAALGLNRRSKLNT